jgi:hypothetical protein
MSVTQGRKATRLASWAAALAVASALAVGTPVPVSAAAPDFSFDLPAGVACAFPLRVEGTGDKRIMREFTDRNGNVVRLLSAGKGFTLTFTNTSPGGESLTLQSNGSVERTTVNSDGTRTVVSTGHNVLILFPTDIPAGPSTTLYVGQIVYTIDADGVFTLQSTSGTTTDICALLA